MSERKQIEQAIAAIEAQRAVLAGLAILENIRPLRQKMQSEQNLSFNVRVGINTGLAVIGLVGSDTADEYTAMGDAVNLAARMEQTAEPGTVQIAENTYQLVAPIFDIVPLDGIALKGKAQPVPSYRVLGHKTVPGHERGIVGLESPWFVWEAQARCERFLGVKVCAPCLVLYCQLAIRKIIPTRLILMTMAKLTLLNARLFSLSTEPNSFVCRCSCA